MRTREVRYVWYDKGDMVKLTEAGRKYFDAMGIKIKDQAFPIEHADELESWAFLEDERGMKFMYPCNSSAFEIAN